jgi:hypothetical protein
MLTFQIYEILPDGTEWHSVPQEVAEHRHMVQSIVAGYTGRKRAAIAPDGTLLYGLGDQQPNGRAPYLLAWVPDHRAEMGLL